MDFAIVAIHGEIGAGKDTVGKMLAEQLVDRWLVENRRFATTVKENISNMTGIAMTPIHDLPYANQVYDFTREQKEIYLPAWDKTIGQMLQIYATEAVRDHLHEDAWILSLEAKLDRTAISIITDLRFENEVSFLKKKKALLIKVIRTADELKLSRDTKHRSEQGLSNEHFDYIIDNSGTIEELKEQVLAISRDIKGVWH